MICIHCEPNEFLAKVQHKKLSVFSRVYVLDNAIAGIVYMCKSKCKLYYLDRFFTTEEKKDDLCQCSKYELHDNLYRLINLTEACRTA